MLCMFLLYPIIFLYLLKIDIFIIFFISIQNIQNYIIKLRFKCVILCVKRLRASIEMQIKYNEMQLLHQTIKQNKRSLCKSFKNLFEF